MKLSRSNKADTSDSTKVFETKTKRYRDPHTGDELTRGEHISWRIQGVIRRWTFLIIFSIVTYACWLFGNPTVLLWWNLSASYLAIVIENTVGIAMFSQTRRDAMVIREIRKYEKADAKAHSETTAIDEDTLARVNEILDRLDQIESRFYNDEQF